jgi:hypothetical protein
MQRHRVVMPKTSVLRATMPPLVPHGAQPVLRVQLTLTETQQHLARLVALVHMRRGKLRSVHHAQPEVRTQIQIRGQLV